MSLGTFGAADCAVALLENQHLIARLPCTLGAAAKLVASSLPGVSVYDVYTAIENLAGRFPFSVCLEDEGESGKYITYYDVESLSFWIAEENLTGDMRTSRINSFSSHSQFSHVSETSYTTWSDTETTKRTRKDLALLLRSQLHLPSSGNALAQNLLNLTYADTKRDMLEKHRIVDSTVDEVFIRVCEKQKCDRACHRTHVHFEPIINSVTDPKLGDCSYLDTCFKRCKYTHYRLVGPAQKKALKGSFGSGARPDRELLAAPRFIKCDLLDFDFSRLGSHYSAIIVDPPWDIHQNTTTQSAAPTAGAGAGTGVPRKGNMSDMDVERLDVGSLQKEGIIFLWVTVRALASGHNCLKAWGYDHVEELVWVKTNQLGRTICTGRTGHWLNHTKETVLVGVKGNPSFLKRQLDADVLVSHARGRPGKPEELYGIVDRAVGVHAPKLELFGRNKNLRPGWLTLGNEVG